MGPAGTKLSLSGKRVLPDRALGRRGRCRHHARVQPEDGTVRSGRLCPSRSKQYIAWVDKDTLLVSRDWGAGSMTKSGYPFVVKLWKRGQALDQAKEVYRGSESDMRILIQVLHDGEGH